MNTGNFDQTSEDENSDNNGGSSRDESSYRQVPMQLHFEGLENIKVLVRVRPPAVSDADPLSVSITNEKALTVTNFDLTKSFHCAFDAVLGPQSSQSDLYELVRDCTLSVLEGVNTTIFAYGQTGSGKTYSMYGPPNETANSIARSNPTNETVMGVIPRAIREIFEVSQSSNVVSFVVFCSFVQIYNENLYDMLRDSSMSNPLLIREDVQGKEIYVQGLSEYEVKNMADMLNLLRISEEHRAIRETHMNQYSSRSHSLFQIIISQKRLAADGGEIELRSKFNLVDLAGSEKWSQKTLMNDEHINEMTNINLSLHTLGRCIAALASRSTKRADSHIPYRDSKLTRLLQDSLGGNSKTVLIATVSPERSNAEESISTLKFADRAKQVMVQARVNEVRPVDHALVLRLQREVEYLRELLRRYVDPMILQTLNLYPNSIAPLHGSTGSVPSTSQTPERTYSSAKLMTGGESFRYSSSFNLNNTSAPAGITGTMQSPHLMLQDRLLAVEREKSSRLRAENESLHHDLQFMKQQMQQLANLSNRPSNEVKASVRSSSESIDNRGSLSERITGSPSRVSYSALGSSTDTDNAESKDDPIVSEFIASLKEAWSGQTGRFWDRFDQLEKILKKFFRFEIEEDDMKAQVSSIMSSTNQLRSELMAPEFLLRRLLNNFHRQLANKLYQDKNPTTSSPQRSNIASSRSEQAINQSFDSSTQSIDSSSLPSTYQRSNRINYSVKKFTGRLAGIVQSSSTSLLPPIQASTESTPSISSPVQPQKPSTSPVGRSTLSRSMTKNDFTQAQANDMTMSMTLSREKPLPALTQTTTGTAVDSSNGAVAYRIRGVPATATTNNSNDFMPSKPSIALSPPIDRQSSLTAIQNHNPVINPQTVMETDEELRIQRELRKMERRLQKQQQQGEILKFKQDKQISQRKVEEEEKKAMVEAEQSKEMKRLQRAEKLKKQLKEYEQRIRTEAEQIEACRRLGIDPASMMS